MGIGIHNHSESAMGTAINAGTKAGAAVGLVAAGKALAPSAKEAFAESLTRQTDLIDKFQKSGLSVDDYMIRAQKTIRKMSVPGEVYQTVKNWEKKGFAPDEIKEKLRNMQDTGLKINKIGADKSLEKLNESRQLFETGKTSNKIAFKDSAEVVLSKVKNKAIAFTNDVTGAFKTTKGSATEKFKAAANSANKFLNNNPAIKKGGKAALIAAAVVGTIAFISKAVNSKKE